MTRRFHHPIWGVVFVVAGALMLSAKGIVTKLMYAQGADVITVAAIRSTLAVPGFWLYAAFTVGIRRLFPADRRALLLALGTGFVSYYVCAYLDFHALTLIDASLERVILFGYPVLIVTARAIADRRRPPAYVTASLLATYTGIFLAVGIFDARLFAANAFGAMLVIVCAAGVALYYMMNERLSRRIGSQAFTVYGMTAAGFGMGVHYALAGTPAEAVALPAEFWWLMALMVVGVTVLPLFLLAEGIARVGATRGSLISTIGPPATIVMAWWFLGERMSVLQLFGALLTIAGVVHLEWRARRDPRVVRAAAAMSQTRPASTAG